MSNINPTPNPDRAGESRVRVMSGDSDLLNVMGSPTFQSALEEAITTTTYAAAKPEVVSATDAQLDSLLASPAFGAALESAIATVTYAGAGQVKVIAEQSPEFRDVLASDAFQRALERAATSAPSPKSAPVS